MIDQLNQVQTGLAAQAEALDEIEDHVDEIEDLAVGAGALSCHGVVANGHCFTLHNQRYNIHTANETCMGKDEHLAEIYTEHEYNTVMDYIRSSDIITDRSLIYVWTGMNPLGFGGRPEGGPGGEGNGPDQGNGADQVDADGSEAPLQMAGRHLEEEFFYRQWIPSYPRRNPNAAYVAWQVVSNPMFADSGYLNVPEDATAYPLCQYHLEDHDDEPIYVDVVLTLDMEFDDALLDQNSQQYLEAVDTASGVAAAILNYTDAEVDLSEVS